MTISREDMDGHISAGRAQRWTHELGPDRSEPLAARFGGIWYVVLEGHEDYQPAPEPLASVLAQASTALDAADAAITRADHRANGSEPGRVGPGADADT